MAEALEVEIQGLTTEINKLNTEQASLQTSIQNVKKETNEMADSVASLLFQIQAQSQDCNVLKSQIVQSPERIKREIVHKSESLEKEKGALLPYYTKRRGYMKENVATLARASRLVFLINLFLFLSCTPYHQSAPGTKRTQGPCSGWQG